MKCARLRPLLAVVALVATATLGGCDSFTQVYQRGYVMPEGALEQVPLGATQDQVLIVLGTPSTVATVHRSGHSRSRHSVPRLSMGSMLALVACMRT